MKLLLAILALMSAALLGYWFGSNQSASPKAEPTLVLDAGPSPNQPSTAPLLTTGPRESVAVASAAVVSQAPLGVQADAQPAEPKTPRQLDKEILESTLAAYLAAPRRDWATGMPENILIQRSICAILDAQGRGFIESELTGVKDVGQFAKQMGGEDNIQFNGKIYPILKGEFPELECLRAYQHERAKEEWSETNRSASDAVLIPEMDTLVMDRAREALEILSKP